MAKDDWEDLPSQDAQTDDWEDLDRPTAELSSDVVTGPSAMESAARGGAQGLLFGLPDELGGAIQSGMDFASGLVGESPSEVNARLAAQGITGDVGPTSSSQMYTSSRDENRQADIAAAEANPYAYRGSELFGSLLGGIGTGAATAGRLGITQGAKLLSKEGLKNAAKLGALGAAEGGIQAGGYSEAGSLGDLASDVAQGAALGGTVGALAPSALGAAGRGLQKAGATTLVGAGIGGTAGYVSTDTEATPMERLGNTLAGIGAGALAGKAVGLTGKTIGMLSDTPVTIFDEGKVSFKTSKDTGRVLGSSEDLMIRQANLEKKAAPIAERINKESAIANLKMQRAENEFVKAQEKLSKAINRSEIDAANKEIRTLAKDLVGTINDSRAKFGDIIEKSYDNLLDVGMKYEPSKVVDDALTKLSTMVGEGVTGQGRDSTIDAFSSTLSKLKSESAGNITDARRLRATIDEMYKTVSDPRLKKVLAETRTAVNQSVEDQAVAQGFENTAKNLKVANDSYSKALLADTRTGAKFGKAELEGSRVNRAARKLESLGGTSSDTQGEIDILENTLRTIAPDKADNLIQRAKAVAMAKRNIEGASKKDIRLSYAEELEAIKNKALSETEKAGMDLEKLTGQQMKLSDSTQASQGLLEKLEGEAAGEVTRLEPVTQKLNQLLPSEADKASLAEAKQAAKDLNLSKRAANKGIRTVATNLPQMILARIGGVGEALYLKGTSVAGVVAGDIEKLPGRIMGTKPSQTVINAMEKAAPEQLKQVASLVTEAAPEAAKKILRLSEATDPVKRRAIMFMLGQDSQFRQAMDQDEEMNMEGSVVTPNEE